MKTKISRLAIKLGCLTLACVATAYLIMMVLDVLNDPLRNKKTIKSFDDGRVVILQDELGDFSVGYFTNHHDCQGDLWEFGTAQNNDNWQDDMTDEESEKLEISINEVIDIDSFEMTYDAKYEHFYTFQDKKNTYYMTIHICDASVFSFRKKRNYQRIKQLDKDKLWLSNDNEGNLYFSHPIAEKCPDDETSHDSWVISADLQGCDEGYLSTCYSNNSKYLSEILDPDSLKITHSGHDYYYLEDKNYRYDMGYSQCNSTVFYEEKSPKNTPKVLTITSPIEPTVQAKILEESKKDPVIAKGTRGSGYEYMRIYQLDSENDVGFEAYQAEGIFPPQVAKSTDFLKDVSFDSSLYRLQFDKDGNYLNGKDVPRECRECG